MKILITLPTHNEALVIEKNLNLVWEFLENNFLNIDWQILIADNASTDETIGLAKKVAAKKEKIIVWHTDQKGRGQALKKAWKIYSADIYIYMDADLAADLKHLVDLVTALQNFDLATGSRLLSESKTERSWFRELISRSYNFIAHRLVPLPAVDTQCGFKAINQAAWEKLLPVVNHSGWFFDTELLAWAKHLGLKTAEIPITWRETRDKKRKSRVKIFSTAWDDIKNLIKLRTALKQKR